MAMLRGSWKTTALGLISARIRQYRLHAPDDFSRHRWLVHLARFVLPAASQTWAIAARTTT